MVGGDADETKLTGLDCAYKRESSKGVVPTTAAIYEAGTRGLAGLLYMSVMSVGPKKETIAAAFTGDTYL
jgi:hypothetical protein